MTHSSQTCAPKVGGFSLESEGRYLIAIVFLGVNVSVLFSSFFLSFFAQISFMHDKMWGDTASERIHEEKWVSTRGKV